MQESLIFTQTQLAYKEYKMYTQTYGSNQKLAHFNCIIYGCMCYQTLHIIAGQPKYLIEFMSFTFNDRYQTNSFCSENQRRQLMPPPPLLMRPPLLHFEVQSKILSTLATHSCNRT